MYYKERKKWNNKMTTSILVHYVSYVYYVYYSCSRMYTVFQAHVEKLCKNGTNIAMFIFILLFFVVFQTFNPVTLKPCNYLQIMLPVLLP